MQRQRRPRAVATVIGGVLIAVVLLVAIALYFYLVRMETETINTIAKIASERLSTTLLAGSIQGTYTYSSLTSTLTITIKSSSPRAVTITSIDILWNDKTTLAIDRLTNLAAAGVTAALYTATGTTETVDNFPVTLGPGDKLVVTVTQAKRPLTVVATLSASPAVASIVITEKRNATTAPAAPATPYNISLLPAPLEGYVVADKAYAATLGSPRSFEPHATILVGTLVGGSDNSLKYRDGDTLQIESAPGPRCINYRDWHYYREVTIHNPNNYDYTDIQVDINLTSSNFNFSRARSDGTDIRIVLDNDACTPLDYWVEKWDPQQGEARIWVKLPSIQANSDTRILILYGNPSATSHDPEHHGLTKVMTRLPANDGPGYTIQYQEWIMPDNRFQQDAGNPMGWHGDDNAWSYTLPFNFPYYSETKTSAYVCSNGFIIFDRRNTDYTSTDGELRRRKMIAPFWADLRTDRGNSDIFVDEHYSDEYGNGVYIRWKAVFYPSRGDVNFAAVLYSNGLIRFDYGTITGSSSTDDTQVVGVSFGDQRHYTIASYDYNKLGTYPSNYTSLMLWPRNVPSQPFSVTIGPEEDNQNARQTIAVRIDLARTSGYIYVENFSLMASISPSGSYGYSLRLLSQAGTLVEEQSGTTGNTIDTVMEPRRPAAGGAYALLTVSSTQPFTVYIDLANGYYRPISITREYIAATSNTTDKIYIYNPYTNTTNVITMPHDTLPATGYTALAPDPTLRGAAAYLWVARGTHAVPVNAESGEWNTTMTITLDQPVGPGAVLASNGTHLYYIPGNASETIYIYDIETKTLTAAKTLPQPLTPWAAAARSGDTLYIHPGEANTVIEVSLTTAEASTSINAPILYPVGMCYDQATNRLWLIARGGGIYIYKPSTGTWTALNTTLPYYPLNPGDRLVCAAARLYHVRGDGTADLLVLAPSRK